MAALFPERCRAMVSVSGYLIGSQEAGKKPLPPRAELQWWYQFYFATERGREGYEKYRNDFNRLIWQLASPQWLFDDATFGRSAASFDNPDHVAIVIHNYRWRQGLAQGDPKLDEFEKKLATAPRHHRAHHHHGRRRQRRAHPPPEAYAKKFSGKYEHRNITGGIGHNLPQEPRRPLPRPSSTSPRADRQLRMIRKSGYRFSLAANAWRLRLAARVAAELSFPA
jgi:hypothetical protein